MHTTVALSNRPMIRGWDSVGGQSEAGATNKGSGVGICSKTEFVKIFFYRGGRISVMGSD